MTTHNLFVNTGDQVFLGEGGEEIGAVREVARDHLVVYVENAVEFRVTGDAIKATHDGKVVLEPSRLDASFLAAASRAHVRETE